jgi:hypothetical protein
MEALWMISGAAVVSLVTALLRFRRSTPTNLGYVSRDWVIRHSAD